MALTELPKIAAGVVRGILLRQDSGRRFEAGRPGAVFERPRVAEARG